MTQPVVIVTKDESHHLESQKVINHANSSDRKWLTSHIFWAVRNNRSVQLCPIRESDRASYPNITPLTFDSI